MGQGFAQTWNEATPAGTDYIRDGDDAIRNFKIAFRERFNVDHYAYSSETGYVNVGMHKQITFGERSSNPTAVTDYGFLFCKNDGGDTELYWMDAAGNVLQLTADGDVYGFSNFLRADGTVPLTADWDAGSYKITAEQFESDVATGTAPFIVASTTKVDNLNADTVDGLGASDIFGSGKIYDSGWFAVSTDTDYTKAHGLGTAVLMITVLYSSSADGSSAETVLTGGERKGQGQAQGCIVIGIGSTNLTVRTGGDAVNIYDNWGITAVDGGNNRTQATSGYYKIIAIDCS